MNSNDGRQGHVRVFLSHSHGDRAIVTELQRVLGKYGAETFLDQDTIDGGDVLPDRIRQGIASSDVVVLLWSSSAARSKWVNIEWKLASEMGKKIVPYCLDATALPSPLDRLVYIDRADAKVSHAGLVTAIFGRAITPPPTELFPGRWIVTLNAFDLVGAYYDLDLRGNGQITGSARVIDESGSLNELMPQELRGLLRGAMDLTSRISGSWSYDEHTELLTLDLTAHSPQGETNEIIHVRTTGREHGEIRGEDLVGRTYVLSRMLGPQSANTLARILDGLGQFRDEATALTLRADAERLILSTKAVCDNGTHARDLPPPPDRRTSPDLFRTYLKSMSLEDHIASLCGAVRQIRVLVDRPEPAADKVAVTKALAAGAITIANEWQTMHRIDT